MSLTTTMTIQQAREILKKSDWFSYEPGSSALIKIDGDFSQQEIEAIWVLMCHGASL